MCNAHLWFHSYSILKRLVSSVCVVCDIPCGNRADRSICRLDKELAAFAEAGNTAVEHIGRGDCNGRQATDARELWADELGESLPTLISVVKWPERRCDSGRKFERLQSF